MVIGLEGPSKQIGFIEIKPIQEIGVHIESRRICLRINVIQVTYLRGEFCCYTLL